MNRMRIVAVIAASVGGAIAAGSFFGDNGEPGVAQLAPAPMATPEPSLVGLAAPSAPTPAPSVQERALEGSAMRGGVVQANILPTPSQPLPPRDAMTPRDMGAAPASFAPASEVVEIAALDPAAPALQGPLPREAPLVSGADLVQLDITQEVASDIDPEILSQIGNCAVFVVATPEANAMLEVSIFAPCDGDATVSLTHGGMQFDERLSPEGLFMATIPALSDPAEVSVSFADARVETDTTAVPDFADVTRLVLQWSGMAELALVAWEEGLDQPIAPQSPVPPLGEAGGMLTVLGMPGAAQAQVYTWPFGTPAAGDDVTLEIEAAITTGSCGADVRAQTLLVNAADPVRQQTMEFTMPACDDVGGYILLHNLLPQLTLAQN